MRRWGGGLTGGGCAEPRARPEALLDVVIEHLNLDVQEVLLPVGLGRLGVRWEGWDGALNWVPVGIKQGDPAPPSRPDLAKH
eukprot:15470967-Alexandrium_andersonii.AAC.1